MISSDALAFVLDAGNLCLLLFFVISLARDLSILPIFSKNQLFVSWIVYIVFLFSIFIDICSYIISIFLLPLDYFDFLLLAP